VRMFRHADGALALFNGMSATPADTLATLLAYTDARSQPMENALHSGFQRLQARSALVVMDAGPPPPEAYSGRAHAGCLSFEFSDGPCRIVVNCGAPPPGAEQWRQMARATAAHSTATVNDTSSCRFVAEDATSFLGSPILSGPRNVPMQRMALREPDEPGVGVQASHDGYAPSFGVLHERRLTLDLSGARLSGRDSFPVVSPGRAQASADAFALRFHLHPHVRAEKAADGLTVALTLPGGSRWRFGAGGLPIALEESIFFAAPDGARRSEQLVIHGAHRATPHVDWAFTRENGRPGGQDGPAPAAETEPDPQG
jgi:uncharacterized heparinase superfamily protein